MKITPPSDFKEPELKECSKCVNAFIHPKDNGDICCLCLEDENKEEENLSDSFNIVKVLRCDWCKSVSNSVELNTKIICHLCDHCNSWHEKDKKNWSMYHTLVQSMRDRASRSAIEVLEGKISYTKDFVAARKVILTLTLGECVPGTNLKKAHEMICTMIRENINVFTPMGDFILAEIKERLLNRIEHFSCFTILDSIVDLFVDE